MAQLNDLLVLGKTSLIGDVNLSYNLIVAGLIEGKIKSALVSSNGTKYLLFSETASGGVNLKLHEDVYYYYGGTYSSLNVGKTTQNGILTLWKIGYNTDIKSTATANREILLPDKTGTLAMQTTWNDFIHSGNEFTFASAGYGSSSADGAYIWLNYRTASGTTDGKISGYKFGNGNKGISGVTVEAETFKGALSGNATSATGFASAKTIALTGNVTGSVTGGNGSNGWSIATTVANVPNAALPRRIQNYSTSGYDDANDATEQGFHYMTTTATNRPSFVGNTTNKDYRILTTAYSSSWVQQIATDFRCNEIYYRRKENGTWKSWVEIPTFDNVINNTAVGASGWVSGTAKRQLINHNTLAYWNGAYSGTSSNLQYCDRGRFGTIVTKNTGDYAAASHGHSYLSGWGDTRSAATTPNDYNGQFKVVGIKQKSLMDIDGSSYSSLIGFRGWSDSSGGNAHELAFTGNGNLYHRHGATTAWNGWNRIPMCGTANTFSGTNTFSGQVIISNTTDAALSSASGALRIGAITGEHMAIDGNEIMAKTSASATGTLYLNNEGGLVQIGSGGLTVNGTATATTFSGSGASLTALNANNISSGTLAVARGGTGKTTGKNACNYFLNELTKSSSTPVDADYYISQYVGGGTTTTTYHRRPMSALWTYIREKADNRYAKKEDLPMTEKLVGTYYIDQSDESTYTYTLPTADYDFLILQTVSWLGEDQYGLDIKIVPTTTAQSYIARTYASGYANVFGKIQVSYVTTKDKLKIWTDDYLDANVQLYKYV